MQNTPITLTQILRLSFLKRWHIVNVNKIQSVAEHSFNVAFIAREILRLGWPRHTHEEELEVMEAALWHDVPEVVFGDVVPPLKRHLKGLLQRDVFSELEEKLCPAAPGLGRAVTNRTKSIVRAADLLEALRFLLLEGVGLRSREINVELAGILESYIVGVDDFRLTNAVAELYEEFRDQEDTLGYLNSWRHHIKDAYSV